MRLHWKGTVGTRVLFGKTIEPGGYIDIEDEELAARVFADGNWSAGKRTEEHIEEILESAPAESEEEPAVPPTEPEAERPNARNAPRARRSGGKKKD